MDLTQRKLNKSEWESIEIPVSESEQKVLKLIINGFNNVNNKINEYNSLISFLKIEYSEKMEDYLFNRYFREIIDSLIKKYSIDYINISVSSDIKIKSADKIRLEKNNNETIIQSEIYEFILMFHLEKIIKTNFDNIKLTEKKKMNELEQNNKLFMFHYFTLFKLIKNNIIKINRHILSIINSVLLNFQDNINIALVIENAVEYIEKNESLLKYADMELYEHQKEIFTICKQKCPKIVLYTAPTGTGKTLSPLALSETHKIIFVCAARHVGLALAKAAISAGKKVAFAFGCSSAADIRLHYFAAKVYTKNKRTGGIGKVDNSVGSEVEIMICDIKSYLPAMYYMKAFSTKIVFNKESGLDHVVEDINQIITYWDEPTITMDYENHEFHKIIRRNWKKNLIPNMVLSSATLPKLHELTETITDFKNKFDGAQVFSIVSHDCKKSIPLINKDGYVVLPHHLNENYDEVLKIARHCQEHLTLLRYFDLKEVVTFITLVNKNNFCSMKMKINRHFSDLNDVNMTSIKIYYINLLQNIISGMWGAVYNGCRFSRDARIRSNNFVDVKGNKIVKSNSLGHGISSRELEGKPLSKMISEQVVKTNIVNGTQLPVNQNQNPGIYVTTKDAFTLTDGPTIFLSNDVEKIAKFCIQQANIPVSVMNDLMTKIEFNNSLNERLNVLEKNLEDISEKAENSISESSNKFKGRVKSSKDPRKLSREPSKEPKDKDKDNTKGTILEITNEINVIRSMIKTATLNDTFVPNKILHLNKWAEGLNTSDAFTSNIEESIVSEIMLLHGIEDSWKILLMMGIGVFTNHNNITYTEIMKKLADSQKLYMIIASSDYIYGTNYQFCHAYLSKDLNLTQEKIVQALGRVGRFNIQQNYTVRFRDDSQILKLLTTEYNKPEVINMNKLFNSNKVIWDGENYILNSEKDSDTDDEADEESPNTTNEDHDEDDEEN
jgi:hypothetical protein